MFSLDVDVSRTGPLLSGRAAQVIEEALAYALTQVGQAASEGVHRILDERIVHPTPYYETQITLDHPPGQVRVHDRGVEYGPWLEGVSSRNRTTRFPGYHAFGQTAQSLSGGRAQRIAEDAVARYVARLGGDR